MLGAQNIYRIEFILRRTLAKAWYFTNEQQIKLADYFQEKLTDMCCAPTSGF
jgi:hypothetical protein